MSIPGEHNVQNATGAVAIAHHLGIGDAAIRAGLAGFGGVKRRFTLTGSWNGVDVFDDYGHHPVEIAAVLKAARSVAGSGRVIAVVQPHRYTRLRDLFDGFCTCFNDADTVIVAPVYAAGEAPIEGVDRDALVEGLRLRGHRDARPLAGPRGAGRHGPRRRSGRATLSSASAPGRSASGPMRCRGNWPRRSAERRMATRSSTPTGIRGRLTAAAEIAPFTWFRVGGPAELLFQPADADDLALFLSRLDPAVPVNVIGVGSNLLVRDGGVAGRRHPPLGEGFRPGGARGRTHQGRARRCRTSGSPPSPATRGSAASPSSTAFPARWAARCG